MFFDEHPHITRLMESGIIHDDDFPRREHWDEALAHILGKDVGVAIALEAERRLQFAPAQRSDHAGATGAVSGFFSKQSLTAFSPATRQAVAVIDTTLINVDKRFCGNTAYRFPPQQAGGFIAFDVKQGFFYG